MSLLLQALNWTTAEKLDHLTALDVEDHVFRKLGDPIWRFLDAKHMTDDRITRIRKYNKQIEAQFDIKHEAAVFTETETVATKKLKKVIFFLLEHNAAFAVPANIVTLLDLEPAFQVKNERGELKEEMRQDTLDFLDNVDLLPEKHGEEMFLRNLEHALLSVAADIDGLPTAKKTALGSEITENLEFQCVQHEFLEQARIMKERMKEAFEKDDRYCATGDEKYYMDLAGKEGEKMLKSDVRKFLADFDARQLSKTLCLKYEKFVLESDCQGVVSFNAKLKACINNLCVKVSTGPLLLVTTQGRRFVIL